MIHALIKNFLVSSKLIFCLCAILLIPKAYCGFDQKQINFGFGMVNAGYTETPVSISSGTGPTTEEAASGSAAIMPFDFAYEIFSNSKRSYLFRTTIAGLMASENSYFFLGGGINFYFKSLSSPGVFEEKGQKIIINPKWRFFWGLDTGISNLVYTTETSQESDILFELGVHTGAVYTVSKKWGARIEASFSRAVGVTVSSMNMKFIFGATRFLF